jgi:hypothetical protein
MPEYESKNGSLISWIIRLGLAKDRNAAERLELIACIMIVLMALFIPFVAGHSSRANQPAPERGAPPTN